MVKKLEVIFSKLSSNKAIRNRIKKMMRKKEKKEFMKSEDFKLSRSRSELEMKEKRIYSFGIILNLVLATFAFAFLISVLYVGEVSGAFVGSWDVGGKRVEVQKINEYQYQLSIDGRAQGGYTEFPTKAQAEAFLNPKPVGPSATSGVKAGSGGDIKEQSRRETPIAGFSELKEGQYATITGKDGGIIASGKVTNIDAKTGTLKVGDRTIPLNQYPDAKINAVPEAPLFGGYSGFSQFFGHIAEGVGWAIMVAGVIQLVGGMMGLESAQTNAMTMAAMGGIIAGKATWGAMQGYYNEKMQYNLFEGNSVGASWAATGIGIVIALIILEMMWKDEKTKVATFDCKPYEAPLGGKDCGLCTKDAYRPCTEYRCKSLGQACELVNSGTGNASCVWVNPKDVNSPMIQTWDTPLTKGYAYNPSVVVRPAKRGVEIFRTEGNDRCVKAFTPLTFGIITKDENNECEYSQCKVDYNHTAKFEQMKYDFGESNLYLCNHTQTLSLPGPDSEQGLSPELKNDGIYSLFVRCRDRNGNENADEFSVKFCVEKGPDETAPDMITTNYGKEAPFTFNTSSLDVQLYVNEPADCKWSYDGDKSYDSMEHNMSCANNVWDMNPDLMYVCSDSLTGLKNRADNKYYFRCRDQPLLEGNEASGKHRNTNTDSFVLNLKGTQPLTMSSLTPYNETVKGFGDAIAVNFNVEVKDGYDDKAVCYYSETANDNDYVMFSNTNARVSTQRLDLVSGTYTYYLKCVDLGGNVIYNSTTFNVESDGSPPKIVRAFKDSEQIRIFTDEESVCSYSTSTCSFAITEGTDMPTQNSKQHSAVWNSNLNYYIKCKDKYDNQPGPAECNSVIRGFNVGS